MRTDRRRTSCDAGDGGRSPAGAWSGAADVAAARGAAPGAAGQGPDRSNCAAATAIAARARILASERVYLVPRADGRLIVGATVEEQGFDTAVTAGGVHELLREAYRLLPEVAEMELVEAMAGLRPGTPDNLPLVGPRRDRRPGPRHRPLPQRHPAGAAGRRGGRRADRAGELRRRVAAASRSQLARRGRPMRIELNGAPRELDDGATLADAVREPAPREGAAESPSPSTARSCRAASGRRRRCAKGRQVEVLAAIQGGARDLG